MRAVFLDRDGVINRERGEHTWLHAHFELLPHVPQALRMIKDAGRLLVVITNQSGIGLGLYDHAAVIALHDLLQKELLAHHVELDAIYYCPHHPSQGKCLCRKPGSLLFEKAIAALGIDTEGTIMIGDRERDIDAARTVGIRGILVEPNSTLLPLVREELLKI